MLGEQSEDMKAQRTEETDKDLKMNKMHHMLSLQGQQLEAMEKRRKREEELMQLNMGLPQSNETLKNVVSALQVTLQDKDDRITKLTADLKHSLDKGAALNGQVNVLSTKLQELEGAFLAQKEIKHRHVTKHPSAQGEEEGEARDEPLTIVELSNNIVCAVL